MFYSPWEFFDAAAAAAGHEGSPGVQISGTREEVPRNNLKYPELGYGNFYTGDDDEPAGLCYMVFRETHMIGSDSPHDTTLHMSFWMAWSASVFPCQVTSIPGTIGEPTLGANHVICMSYQVHPLVDTADP